ncbi:PDDEXK family nuclease [Tellurirhabdus rosea]|uniref:hypothetical protein n=1 Tax=Tellurirhabdus rosea TaxID=2674997 RepID=UPI00224E6D77|nr:hypothetical protein [Tellurirhabdus rosea]
MLTDDLLSFLSAEKIDAEPVAVGAETPFPLLKLAGKALFLHLIVVKRYREQPTEPFFFQHLSDNFGQRGERIIHLWEDVWRLKKEVVQSRLRALAGQSQRIPARLTQVRRLDRPTTAAFLDHNHLQVVTLSKYKYGLFLPARYFRVLSDDYQKTVDSGATELLVAVATFSHPRTIPRNGKLSRSVELVRFANRLNCTVVGGLDKLLKAFIQEQHPGDIMTYADRDWSDGRSYEKLGFERVGTTAPQEFWLDAETLVRHYPHRLAEESEELIPVHNAGSLKFVLNLDYTD